MNPRLVHVALILGAVAAAIFVAGLVFCTLLYGCAHELPPEPPFVMTVTIRDAASP